MEYTIKIPLIIDRESSQVLDGQSRILNWCYNHFLDYANVLRKEFCQIQSSDIAKVLYSERGLRDQLPEKKKDFNFLKSVHSSPLKNAVLRLSRSVGDYQKSRKGIRKGKKTGWPSFRSVKNKFFSLYYDEPNKGFKITGSKLRLSLGVDKEGKRLYVSVQLKTTLENFKDIEVRNLRIVKNEDVYHACICVRKALPQLKQIKKVASIDPNHKNLGYVVGTDGKSIEICNPYFLKTLDKRIDKVKGLRDKCKRRCTKVELDSGKTIYLPSKRYKCLDKVCKKLYRKRREQTKTYLYTIANKLYHNYDLVAVGDYIPRGGGINKGMRRSMNNQSLIGVFKEVLSWVALKSGKSFEIWNERGSTITCSTAGCSFKHPFGLNPSVRSWTCPDCKTNHLRDENAAINGLKKTIEKLPCLGLQDFKLKSRSTWKFTGLGILIGIPGTMIKSDL